MVRKSLNKIKNEYRASQRTTHQQEFKILEKKFKRELDKTAIRWIKNYYDCNKSSREVFTYLENKL